MRLGIVRMIGIEIRALLGHHAFSPFAIADVGPSVALNECIEQPGKNSNVDGRLKEQMVFAIICLGAVEAQEVIVFDAFGFHVLAQGGDVSPGGHRKQISGRTPTANRFPVRLAHGAIYIQGSVKIAEQDSLIHLCAASKILFRYSPV